MKVYSWTQKPPKPNMRKLRTGLAWSSGRRGPDKQDHDPSTSHYDKMGQSSLEVVLMGRILLLSMQYSTHMNNGSSAAAVVV